MFTYDMRIMGMDSASERWRYIVTSSLIGWAHTQSDLCIRPWMARFANGR